MKMKSKSTLYLVIQKILGTLCLQDQVGLYSYEDDFETLWGLTEGKPKKKPIWCVVEDDDTSMKWLPIGIWGRYFRAKHSESAPRLVLIGRKESLIPKVDNQKINVPVFYKDDGLCLLSLESGNVVPALVTFVQRNEAESLDQDMVRAWQALVYSSLSSPGSRHAISNEIAPMVLYDSLMVFQQAHGKEKSIGLADLKKSLDAAATTHAGAVAEAIRKMKNHFEPKPESKAILKLWEWASDFFAGAVSTEERCNIRDYIIPDVWGIHGNARFLLIDEQAESHGYQSLLKAVLDIMIGREIQVDFRTEIADSESEFLDVIANYDCLFLDLRLRQEDRSKRNYQDLTGVKVAIKLSQLDPSFPIVIFSSSQQREVERIFSSYGNVILDFRKPGIAGSLESVRGVQLLESLFIAVRRALELYESRVVYRKILALPHRVILKYRDSKGEEQNISVQTDKELLVNVYKKIFHGKRYELAFTFPYSYFEDCFSERRARRDENTQDLDFLKRISIQKADKNNRSIRVEPNSLYSKTPPRIYFNGRRPANIRLKDFNIHQSTDNISLPLRALNQFRNMASHGLRDFSGCRFEAIAILDLFLNVLGNGNTAKQVVESTSTAFGQFRCDVDERSRVWFPLTRLYHAHYENVRKFTHELFASICYYGSNFANYSLMQNILKSDGNSQGVE